MPGRPGLVERRTRARSRRSWHGRSPRRVRRRRRGRTRRRRSRSVVRRLVGRRRLAGGRDRRGGGLRGRVGACATASASASARRPACGSVSGSALASASASASGWPSESALASALAWVWGSVWASVSAVGVGVAVATTKVPVGVSHQIAVRAERNMIGPGPVRLRGRPRVGDTRLRVARTGQHDLAEVPEANADSGRATAGGVRVRGGERERRRCGATGRRDAALAERDRAACRGQREHRRRRSGRGQPRSSS